MAKYQKKVDENLKFQTRVQTVDAEVFIPEKQWPVGVESGGYEGKNNLPTYYVQTPQGPVEIVSGDFIVTDRQVVNQYPLKPADFHQKYEPHKKEKEAEVNVTPEEAAERKAAAAKKAEAAKS